MKITELIKERIVYFDGGMGTLLQERGLGPGELCEIWNVTRPEDIISIHREYIKAGADIITANTFGANPQKFPKGSEFSYDVLIGAAIGNVKEAIRAENCEGKKYVAFDMGPLGRLLQPLGDLPFEEAVGIFAEQVKVAERNGADLILIETMNDSYETKAAVIAAKENSGLPVFVTNAYDKTEKLMTGADAMAMIAMLEGLGVDAIGLNCSLGPDLMRNIVKTYVEYSSLPIIVNPNAGLPSVENGKTVFSFDEERFCEIMCELVADGARIVGGCCGTTPKYIALLKKMTESITPKPVTKKHHTLISSYTHSVEIGQKPVLIGERINPTGKKRFKQALVERDFDYILNEAIQQQECGVDILDVNVGLPEINEVEMLCESVMRIQEISDLPLQLDTSDVGAMERAMRIYNGKPLVNSVNGKEESMRAIFPLVKKYGGTVIALTLDEKGIPENAKGRIEIVRRILKTAEEYGIEKKDIVIDPLALTISSDSKSARVTLESLRRIRDEFGLNTSLGVSNISFGLPKRDYINGAFYAMALANGLSAAIMNPYSNEMMKIYHSFLALSGMDEQCEKYIEFASGIEESNVAVKKTENKAATEAVRTLQGSVIKGLKEQAARITAELLTGRLPSDLIDNEIIPALDVVGKGYEEKKVFLPQLLMSAEAAKASFEEIKKVIAQSDNQQEKKCTFVIATVKGDIHDIGKNIVKVMLENYGFNVIDLGKDVEPELIADTVVKEKAPLAGLSALMTTTVPSMEETIKLLREKAPWCKIVVGGAVLTEEYAQMIKADKYAADAMETVRYADMINSEKM